MCSVYLHICANALFRILMAKEWAGAFGALVLRVTVPFLQPMGDRKISRNHMENVLVPTLYKKDMAFIIYPSLRNATVQSAVGSSQRFADTAQSSTEAKSAGPLNNPRSLAFLDVSVLEETCSKAEIVGDGVGLEVKSASKALHSNTNTLECTSQVSDSTLPPPPLHPIDTIAFVVISTTLRAYITFQLSAGDSKGIFDYSVQQGFNEGTSIKSPGPEMPWCQCDLPASEYLEYGSSGRYLLH
ncbi:hypothetical protein CB1_001033002 [Camelus ferus]|nr:hypothetical protein CB1_001033002 [Camelus ferus]